MFEFCFKNPDINTFRRLIMEPEDVKDSSLGKTAHTAAPAASQLNEDTSAGETTNCEGNITIEDQQKVVKKEEPEDDGYLYGEISETNVTSVEQSDEEILKTVKEEEPEQDEYLGGGTSVSVRRVVIVDENSEVFQSKPIKEEEPEDDDYLYCEDCRSFFIGECEVHGPVLFIQDTPVPMGVADRAKQTLPQGLEILKSSISDLGVFNKGDTVPVGVHFGPYQGDLVDREEAMKSVYSWVVYKNMQCEEYIDAKRETHANWMRYVNCAPNSEEKNLMAYQYQGGILYRCCQAIKPGQELLVWYEEEYAKHLGVTFDYLWNKKSTNGNEMKSFPLQVFSCSSCSFSYTSQIYLHKHIKRCHNEEYVRLLKCGAIKHHNQTSANSSGQQTSSGTLLTKNGQIQKEIYHCSDCGKSFTNPSYLLQHQQVHTRERPYRCSDCGKSFTRPINLQIHQRIHTGEKLYHCSQCGKDFTRQNHFQLHQHMHTGEKPYQCSECGKSFTRPGNLQLHKRIHTGEKPYHCIECGRSFTQQTSFQLHQRIHTGEKPFCCSQCEKSFTRLSTLQRHQLVHTGEKPFQCSECGKSFTQQVNLQLHQRLHTGEKPCHCAQCGKSFTRLSTLQRHQRVHTGEKLYHCSECGKCFTQQVNLRFHQRVHTGEKPFQCSQCQKSFTHLSTLQRHQRIHTGEKPYLCSQCGKSFTHLSTLQRHQLIHTGEKPYLCIQCGKSFTQLSTLQKHQQIHTKDKTFYSS
ncbi:oocyte zinc finger protein XlCOF6-like [Hemibagrus wyckioides]|uniref:oocyte zinc finger protein XlCOF6-like n=1 Tax=Hemibagrus wyckioides TaxID=337641 RepID=UPI00266B4166|nr:oocyte zinc finger protein XlCOF6-like [Hemibagrus wyckioides]